jgi:hypothetical protein
MHPKVGFFAGLRVGQNVQKPMSHFQIHRQDNPSGIKTTGSTKQQYSSLLYGDRLELNDEFAVRIWCVAKCDFQMGDARNVRILVVTQHQ